MTESEAIKKVKEFGLYHAIGDLPNSALTVKAFKMAVAALEEIQQYREIEAEIKEQYHANVDIKKLMRYFIETIFKGEKHDGFCILTNEDSKMWEKYRAIGTVEECREARERQIPKKPIHDGLYACPNCHTIMLQGAFEAKGKCCKECGQVLDWSETV